MSKSDNKNLLIFFLLAVILAIGILFRIYNINHDDFWIDEMVSFWVSDPKISIIDSYQRNNLSEGFPFLYNLLLKAVHKIIGYEIYIGRYFSAIFGILSIISIGYLSRVINNNKDKNTFILTVFLVSFNVFLIKYSQEARAYSLVFFLSSLILIFYCKSILSYNKKDISKVNLALFIFFQVISIILYPLIIVIFFSIIIYSLIFFIKIKKIIKPLLYSLLLILFFLLLYLPFYFDNIGPYPSWIQQPELKFYTDFYFTKYFGSRILGLIHIFILLFLIIKFRQKFLKNYNLEVLFLLIFIFSYLLPIIYGYLFEPILHQRYIIFTLIPVILIISHLIFEIRNTTLKYLLVFTLTITTIGNQLTEANFKQFFKEREFFKPEISKAFEYIDKSKYKDFSFDKNLYTLGQNASGTNHNDEFAQRAVRNYMSKLIEKNNWKIKHIDPTLNKNNVNYLWIFCTELLIGSKCNKIEYKKKFKVLENKKFKKIIINLIKFE